MQEIVDIMDKAINDLNVIKKKLNDVTKIKYIVVKIDTSGRGVEEVERIEFETVEGAIKMHREKIKDDLISSYWDLVVEYT